MRRLLFTLGQLVCLFAASCSSSPGTEALYEKGSITQTAAFKPLFSEKADWADLVLSTTDAREEKDVLQWCTILHFHKGQYVKFEYQKSRKYNFGASRRRHDATFDWVVDLHADPKNRSLFLVEVRTEFIPGAAGSGPDKTQEMVTMSVQAFIVTKVKGVITRNPASDEAILRCVELILPKGGEVSEGEVPYEDIVRRSYLVLARARALLNTGKGIDAAVSLQKLIGDFNLAGPPPEDRPRYDLANGDYVMLAARGLINEIRSKSSKAPADEKEGAPEPTKKDGADDEKTPAPKDPEDS
jgi:hypothetical protein